MADTDYSTEEWRDIPGTDGRYQVSSMGRVRTAPKILKSWYNSTTGYDYVGLGRGRRSTIHRLVCTAFNGALPGDGMCVAHWDGDRRNNRADNLRWATWSENLADAVRHGTSKLQQYRADPRPYVRGEQSGSSRLKTKQVLEIRRKYETGVSGMTALAREYSVDHETVRRVIRRASWAHV